MKKLILLALMLPACLFDPGYRIDSCELRCESSCPQGYECRAGYCVVPGRESACSMPLDILVEGSPTQYSCQSGAIELTAIGGVGEPRWSVSAGGKPLPDGLHFSSDGRRAKLELDSDALKEQALPVEFQVRDEIDATKRIEFQLDVAACTTAATPPPGPGCIDQPLEVDLRATGGSGNYEWKAVGETLPEWLRLEGTRLVGTPVEAGRFELQLEVTDTLGDETAGAGVTDAEALPFTSRQSLVLLVDDCLRLSADPESASLCAGEAFVVQLTPAGGQPPYVLHVDELPDGVDVDEKRGTISGTASGELSIQATAEDATHGLSDPIAITVAGEPCSQITTKRVAACVNQRLEEPLEVTSEFETRIWTKLEGPDWLDVDASGALVGTPPRAESVDVQLQVSNGQLATRAVVSVVVSGTDSVECDPPALQPLPPACAGEDYEATLSVGGFTENLTVAQARLEAWPSWLQFDPQTRTLSGHVPPGSSARSELGFKLSVRGRISEPSVPLLTLPSCNYAFIARSDERGQLYLGDIRQSVLAQGAQARSLSADLPAELDVVDFAFSRDGERLAYVASPDGNATASVDDRLFVERVSGATGDEFEGEVTELAWSGLRHLAWSKQGQLAAFQQTDDSTELIVMDLNADWPLLFEPMSVRVTGTGELWWLGQDVCFASLTSVAVPGEGATQQAGITCVSVDEDGLGATRVASTFPDYFDEPERLGVLASDERLFFSTQATSADLYQSFELINYAGQFDWLTEKYGIVDPSLGLLAQPGTGTDRGATHPRVGIFRVDSDEASYGRLLTEGVGVIEDCHSLQAWEDRGAAIACEADGALRIAKLKSSGETLAVRTVANTQDFALDVEDQGFPKAFSAGAKWFGYVNDAGQLKIVDLSKSTWSAQLVSAGWSGAARLSSTKEGGSLLIHHGGELSLVELKSKIVTRLNPSAPSEQPYPCLGEFTVGGPADWCGWTLARQRFAKDPTGTFLFYEGSGGTVYTSSLSADLPRNAVLVASAALNCGTSGCNGKFEFAPPAAQ